MSGGEQNAAPDINDGGQALEVAFADAQGRKYPLDTEENIRAAWSSVNDTANAAAHESGEWESIKERIRHAAAQKAIYLDGASPARQAHDEHEENPLDPHRRIVSSTQSEPADR